MLRIPRFLDEGAGATVDHKDEGTGPVGLFFGFWVGWAGGVAGCGVDVGGVAEVGVGVVDVLGDGAAVGGAAEEGFAVVVALVSEESFGDLMGE